MLPSSRRATNSRSSADGRQRTRCMKSVLHAYQRKMHTIVFAAVGTRSIVDRLTTTTTTTITPTPNLAHMVRMFCGAQRCSVLRIRGEGLTFAFCTPIVHIQLSVADSNAVPHAPTEHCVVKLTSTTWHDLNVPPALEAVPACSR